MDDREIIEDQDLKPSMMNDRVCSGCKIEKPATDFYYSTNYRLNRIKNEVLKQIKLCSQCKACMTKRAKAWQKKNAERFKTYQALYHRKLRRQLRRQTVGV